MVGTGKLKNTVEDKSNKLRLAGYVQMLDQIPNDEIWELYRMADTFVNLNQQEIFGMGNFGSHVLRLQGCCLGSSGTKFNY